MKALNKYISALIIISIFASCKKEYLNTAPTNSTSPSTVFATTASAALAVNGLAKLMTQQKISSQGFNGEGTIKMYYGNYAGNHFGVNLPGFSIPINMEFYANPTSTYGYYPWYYYYSIIGNANTIINRIDAASGPESEKQYIKAQALTFRAYAYTMLAQLYGNRWSDSNNGATSAVVLRIDESTGDIPLSTLKQTYDLIYSDLNTAINLFTASGKTRSAAQFYLTDINVAYATYARAALNRQDYAAAENYANKARQSFPLMTVAQYKTGFNTSNSEWIWGSYGATDETLFFYSFFAYIAYNSTASTITSTPRYMSKDLYNKIPATDIRKALFLDPKNLAYNTTTGEGSAALTAAAKALYPAMQSAARSYPYMQFKFSATDMPGVGNLNHFRSSEMILIEAEAKYFQNKPASDIQALMNTLTKTSLRDPNYNCTATGTALFDEIKLYRAIELWGEGFDFFDLKRWGDKIERKSFANGGNFVNILATTILPNQANNWKIVIPSRETDYNGAFNP
ncbi:MAG: RagB/SusD family nutrient uptake outer membrane protein [Sphingobacteriaceae bacterium]|nr:RagB/SusD family nutrient uptake outer membrane protein [Sphingobacteriaceae bacterium]